MENASQALIIAAGVLIAIVLISLGIYVYVSLHNVSSMQDEKIETEQLIAFNKKYEAYNKSLMRGTDVVTVFNMAEQDRISYGYNINVQFTMIRSNVYSLHRDTDGSETRVLGDRVIGNDINAIMHDEELKNDFKRRIFSCTGVHYNDQTGRIDSITFMEEELTDKQYEHK